MRNARRAFCGFLLTTTAMLAGAARAAEPATGPAEPEQGAVSVEEIVVTAQRREQSLQKVPIALSVLGADMAAKRGVTSTQDLAMAVPGVYFTQLFTGGSFYIRGIGKNDTNTGQEMPVAVYVDGVYLATPTGSLFGLNNIQRVEVLKGPQGTLFGRNATGGVIQVVTKDPRQEPSFTASVGYGNYATVQGSAYGTTGLAPNLAADLAVSYSNQGEGWGRNVYTGNDVYKGHEFNIRSKLLWTPTDRTSVTLAGDYADLSSDVGTAVTVYPGSVGFLGTTNPGFYNINSEIPRPFSAFHQWGVAGTIKQDLSWARLVSISSYRELRERVVFDADATPFYGVVASRHYPAETFTQEIQLLSPAESKIQWIGGLYFLNQKTSLAPLVLEGLGLGAGPTFKLFRNAVQRTDSYAAFAEVVVPVFSDSTHFTAGGRYTVDQRHLEAQDTDTFGTPYPPYPDQKKTWSSPSWRFTLDHQFSEGIFGYAQYSRGFKSGQFNVVQPGDPPVRPEIVDAYEIGLKTTTFDHRLRLNLSSFFYKYQDIQLSRAIVGGNQLFNAASAEMKGFDADFEFAASSHLTFNGGLSYLDAKFTDFPLAPSYAPAPGGGNSTFDIPNAAGNSLTNAPKWQANLGALYTIPSSVGLFTISSQYAYNSGFYFAASNRLKQPAFNMINASIDWLSPSETWGLRIWGKNLADEKVVSYNSEQAFGDLYSVTAPLTFGATITYHFGS